MRAEYARELFNELPMLPEIQALVTEYLVRHPGDEGKPPLALVVSTRRRFEVARRFILELRKVFDGTGDSDMDALRDHLKTVTCPASPQPLSAEDL